MYMCTYMWSLNERKHHLHDRTTVQSSWITFSDLNQNDHYNCAGNLMLMMKLDLSVTLSLLKKYKKGIPLHGRSQDFQRGGHTDSYIGYSPNCHLNIVGCLLTKRLTKGGSRAPQDPPPPGYALAAMMMSTRRLRLGQTLTGHFTLCTGSPFPPQPPFNVAKRKAFFQESPKFSRDQH